MKTQCFLSILLFLIHHSLCSQNFIYEDKVYDEDIRTVRLFPAIGEQEQELLSAAAPLSGEYPLLLEFDHLFSEYESYYVKFIHCNADWTPSRLFPLDFINDFNEFLIEDYEFSFNTRVPYVHYQYPIPLFKIPGNYLLIVYRESEENVVLSKRFMIYDNRVGLQNDLGSSVITTTSRLNQEIRFTVEYGGRIQNPHRNVNVTIRQNQRWDNAIHNLSPTFANEASRTIEFSHFAGENQFNAGNQFRFFDLRSLRYFGRYVESVDLSQDIAVARLEQDKPRGNERYSEEDDQNGKYTIPHPFESDYAFVEFILQTEPLDTDIFVAGDFSLWSRDDMYKLEYIEELGGYYKVILLKQGLYDYQYIVDGPNSQANRLEGDHFQTENEYDIMVYYYSFEQDADLLIGYFSISKNPRF